MPCEVKKLQEKLILQYKIDRDLAKLRDIFVTLMSRNCYEPADADRLDTFLDQVYRSGKIAGINYALDKVKTALPDW